MKLEQTILKNLIFNEEYLRKVLPFLKSEYFQEKQYRYIYESVASFVEKYNKPPTFDAIELHILDMKNIREEELQNVEECLTEFKQTKEDAVNVEWLVDTTEKFCQEKAIYNAILGSISILDGKDKNLDKGAIPKILSDALGVSFDTTVGHDYLMDSDARFEFYHRKEERIPFDLNWFNKITKGGLPTKCLVVALAGTGVGKSLFMCHCAAANLIQGKNVLYITMELAEERIAERIDANLLNVNLDDLIDLPKEFYDKRVNKIREKTVGKLVIKEYPTASASTTHFRALLNELNLKKSFKPDIIYIDYLNICASARIKQGNGVNSYTYIKAIAEELRGLAVEYGVPVVSATQTTRSGYGSSDPGLEDTSESFGLPATADMMFALIDSEELRELNQVMVKQLKNRFSDAAIDKRFVIGIDRAKMRLYDVEQSGQHGIADAGKDKPLNTFGDRDGPVKKSFDNFKF